MSSKQVVFDVFETSLSANVSVAVWTDWFLLQPLVDTYLVEFVFADWHLSDALFFLEIVAANRANFFN